MAYDRYDPDDRWRDEPRGHGEGRGRRGRDRFGDEDYGRGERDERGFFERAGDEIASWFGDEEAERRRQRDQRMSERDRYRDYRPDYGPSRRERERDRSFRPMGWTASDRDYRRGYDPSFEPRGYGEVGGSYGPGRGYRPMTGDYGRGGPDRGEPFDQDEYRRTSFAGSSASSQWDDPHYEEWKRREIDALDREYEDYCRERQSRFEQDFAGWRETRQSKRQLLGQVREQMEVVGKDERHVGTIDRVAGDRLILTKSDPDSGGVHHSISCTMIDRIDGDRVVLDQDAETARQRWRDESRERALFEREDQGRAGPGILNRSFSGTYR